jgi:hypothetical protein
MMRLYYELRGNMTVLHDINTDMLIQMLDDLECSDVKEIVYHIKVLLANLSQDQYPYLMESYMMKSLFVW